jgi:glucose/arabinose dehydrogenase
MKTFAVARRSPNRHLSLLATVLLSSACGDDSSSGPAASAGSAGASGGSSAAGSGGGGSGGAAGGGTGGASGSTSGGTSGGGAGGSGGSPVVPDPLKDCGVAASPSVPPIVLTPLVVDGLVKPVFLTQPPGDTTRLFVIEKAGRVRIIENGALVEAPFLTIPGVNERYDEMGLLGLAFHPDYQSNGRFFVYYSTLLNGDQHYNRVAEYHVSPGSPGVADAASERVLMQVLHDEDDNHNGGDIAFNRDGFLYIGLGDGGGGGDMHGSIGNGQLLSTFLGKILRIDVDGTGAGGDAATDGADAGATVEYGIPAGNLTREGALPEIWSYGLRNPWRYSFDPCTGDMYIGDVGQNQIEEIDFEPYGAAGKNYGWRLMEGADCFNPNSGCNAATQDLVLPVATYDHDVGNSITGGYVYRGAAIPNLRGTYLYADYQSARFFALRMQNGSVAVAQTEITDNINPGGDIDGITSFGEDGVGNLYVLTYGGGVYRIDAE